MQSSRTGIIFTMWPDHRWLFILDPWWSWDRIWVFILLDQEKEKSVCWRPKTEEYTDDSWASISFLHFWAFKIAQRAYTCVCLFCTVSLLSLPSSPRAKTSQRSAALCFCYFLSPFVFLPWLLYFCSFAVRLRQSVRALLCFSLVLLVCHRGEKNTRRKRERERAGRRRGWRIVKGILKHIIQIIVW